MGCSHSRKCILHWAGDTGNKSESCAFQKLNQNGFMPREKKPEYHSLKMNKTMTSLRIYLLEFMPLSSQCFTKLNSPVCMHVCISFHPKSRCMMYAVLFSTKQGFRMWKTTVTQEVSIWPSASPAVPTAYHICSTLTPMSGKHSSSWHFALFREIAILTATKQK